MSRWSILADREAARVAHSSTRHPNSPEEVFYSVANSLKHRASNRYTNIFAYDRTAVSVKGFYLNANIVKHGDRWWVASQAPIPSTFASFFRALKEGSASKHPLVQEHTHAHIEGREGSKGAVIVQLTGYEENGMIKADKYIDALRPESSTYNKQLASTITECDADGVPVTHYHFTAWPDHGVPSPSDHPALIALIVEVGRRQVEEEKEVWVHCSAGVGRSGAFIALSSLLLRKSDPVPTDASPLGELPLPRSDRVAHTIDEIREYRGMLVQTPEQMKLVDTIVSKS